MEKTFTKIPNRLFYLLETKEITTSEFTFICLVYKYNNSKAGLKCSLSYGSNAIRVNRNTMSKIINSLIRKEIIVRFNVNNYKIHPSFLPEPKGTSNPYFELYNSVFEWLRQKGQPSKTIKQSQFILIALFLSKSKFAGYTVVNKNDTIKILRCSLNTYKSNIKALLEDSNPFNKRDYYLYKHVDSQGYPVYSVFYDKDIDKPVRILSIVSKYH